MWSKTFAIAANTFLETIRQPIYGILLIATCMMMVLNVSLAAYTLSDDNIFLRDLGLSTLLVSGLFLAAFSAAGVITREIENKTVLTLLSKPLKRPTFIFGKFIGLVSALTTAFYICTLAFLLVVRHKVMSNSTDPWDFPVILFGLGAVLVTIVVSSVGNYWYGWQFSSTAVGLAAALLTLACLAVSVIDHEWKPQLPQLGDWQLMAAICLVLFMVWIIAACALAVSCRTGQVTTLSACAAILMIGLTTDHFFGQHVIAGLGLVEQPTILTKLAWLAYRAIPNLGIFWVADALDLGKRVSPGYVVSALAYALLYIAAILLVGVAVFQKREVG